MLPLPEIISKGGFQYSLIKRGRRACLYRQTDNTDSCFYEVFVLRIAPEKNFQGKILQKREIFPRNQDFGKYAWTKRTLEEANKKFDALELGK
jgi:hypothetical protein